MVYSLGTDVLGAGLNGEKRLEMRYMVGCKDGGLSLCIQIRSLCYRSVRALARFVADSVAGDCSQRSVSPHYCNWADVKKSACACAFFGVVERALGGVYGSLALF